MKNNNVNTSVTEDRGEHKKKRKAYLKLSLLAFILVVVPPVLFFLCKNTLFNVQWLKNFLLQLNEHPEKAAGALIGLQILQVVVCFLPGQPIQLASSFLYGTFGGYVVSIVGTIIGSWIACLLARFLGVDAVRQLFGREKVDEYRKKLNGRKGLLVVLLVYLIPGLPKDLVCYAAGISGMHILPFLIISTIGRTPPMLGSLLFGSALRDGNYTALILIAAVCAIVLILCWLKRDQLKKFLDQQNTPREGM